MEIINFNQMKPEEIKELKPEALQEYAEKQAVIIVQKIESAVEEIESLKEISFENNTKESFWDGIFAFFETGKGKSTRDKEELISQLNLFKTKSSDGMLKLVAIIQESIKFSCTSIEFAQSMNKAMAAMMANGFKDTNGNIREMNAETVQFANYILDQADAFVTNQKNFDSRMNELDDLYKMLKEASEVQGEKIDSLYKQTEENRTNIERQKETTDYQGQELKKQAEKNELYEKALSEQQQKDVEHDQLLSEQKQKDIEHDQLLAEQKQKDIEHDQLLAEQKQKDTEHDQLLAELSMKINKYEGICSEQTNQIERLSSSLEERIKRNRILICISYITSLFAVILSIMAYIK